VWLNRRAQGVRTWFNGRSRFVRLLVVVTVFASGCLAASGFLLLARECAYRLKAVTPEDREFLDNDRWGYESGLPSTARRLKAEMEPYPDPDTALQHHPEWAAVRLKNGEWVFGHGLNSHDYFLRGRGTWVGKDSRGRVRIFFGHVCGTNAGFDPVTTNHLTTLDEYYDWLAGGRLREWVPPD
jgi:hypothetical protein